MWVDSIVWEGKYVKRVVCLLMAALLVMPLAGCLSNTPAEEAEVLADRLVSVLAAGDYSQAVKQFDRTMRGRLPAPQLKAVWEQLISQVGPYQQQLATSVSSHDELTIVVVATQFEQSIIDIRVVYNQKKQVVGLFFVPSNYGYDYNPPPYADLTSFTEREISVGDGQWSLPGLLSIPQGSGPFPAVILVHGSGPNDRDETIGPNKPLRDIAYGLASRGIAVLRYDKRTLVHAEQVASLRDGYTVQEEVIDDAVAAYSLLTMIPEIAADSIYLLGHSLGGLLAPRIAQQAPGLAGLIILAAPSRPLEEVILEQVNYLVSLEPSPEAETQAQLLAEQVARVQDPNLSPTTPASELPLGVPAAYWLDLRDYDPVQVAQSLALPMFIMQGERDYQVTMADFQLWQAGLAERREVQFRSYAPLNHLFMSGSGPITPQEYMVENHVAEQVIADMAGWILSR